MMTGAGLIPKTVDLLHYSGINLQQAIGIPVRF
jgi:hypothetical protein